MADDALSTISSSVAQTNLKVVGEAPAHSVAIVYQVLAETIGLSMQVTQSVSSGLQQLGTAATALATSVISKQISQ